VKSTKHVLAAALLFAAAAGCVIGAPSRPLTDVSGPLPTLQWFIRLPGPIEATSAEKEFYDNAQGPEMPSIPWGGLAGSRAIYGWVARIDYNMIEEIIGFAIEATITNDSYVYDGVLAETKGGNDHQQTAPDIAGQAIEVMRNTRVTASFADTGLTPDPTTNIHAVGYDELGWYCYSLEEPPLPQPNGDYVVPTWDFGTIPPGGTVTRRLEFVVSPPEPPGTRLFALLQLSNQKTADVLANRTTSLKISQFVDTLFGDDGTAWPGPIGSSSSDVSVFFDSVRVGSLTVDYGPNTPANHFWWPGDRDPNEMFQLVATADRTEDIRLQSITLQAVGSGNDATDISRVELYVDRNGNGLVDPDEPLIGSGVYLEDDGKCVISIFALPGYLIPAGTSVDLIVAYRMAPVIPPWSNFSFTAIEAQAYGVTSGVPVSINGLPLYGCWKTVISTPAKVTIGKAKQLDIGSLVLLEGKVVTAEFWGSFWIEEIKRAAGIRVWMPSLENAALFSPGRFDVVTVLGRTTLAGPEAAIELLAISPAPLSIPTFPVGMNNRATGGRSFGIQPGVIDRQGPLPPLLLSEATNNIGLLERTWGRVTWVSPDGTQFWIDDGTALWDGTMEPTGKPVLGVCVQVPTDAEPPGKPTYVAVTGVMRCKYNDIGLVVRWLWPRDRWDIDLIPEGPPPE